MYPVDKHSPGSLTPIVLLSQSNLSVVLAAMIFKACVCAALARENTILAAVVSRGGFGIRQAKSENVIYFNFFWPGEALRMLYKYAEAHAAEIDRVVRSEAAIMAKFEVIPATAEIRVSLTNAMPDLRVYGKGCG